MLLVTTPPCSTTCRLAQGVEAPVTWSISASSAVTTDLPSGDGCSVCSRPALDAEPAEESLVTDVPRLGVSGRCGRWPPFIPASPSLARALLVIISLKVLQHRDMSIWAALENILTLFNADRVMHSNLQSAHGISRSESKTAGLYTVSDMHAAPVQQHALLPRQSIPRCTVPAN